MGESAQVGEITRRSPFARAELPPHLTSPVEYQSQGPAVFINRSTVIEIALSLRWKCLSPGRTGRSNEQQQSIALEEVVGCKNDQRVKNERRDDGKAAKDHSCRRYSGEVVPKFR